MRSDKVKRVGMLKCRICSTHYASKTHNLSAQVDVYCAWIDECDRLNSQKAPTLGKISVAAKLEDEAHQNE